MTNKDAGTDFKNLSEDPDAYLLTLPEVLRGSKGDEIRRQRASNRERLVNILFPDGVPSQTEIDKFNAKNTALRVTYDGTTGIYCDDYDSEKLCTLLSAISDDSLMLNKRAPWDHSSINRENVAPDPLFLFEAPDVDTIPSRNRIYYSYQYRTDTDLHTIGDFEKTVFDPTTSVRSHSNNPRVRNVVSRILTDPEHKNHLIILPCFTVSTDSFNFYTDEYNARCKGFILCDARDLSDDEADAFRSQAMSRWQEIVNNKSADNSEKDPNHGYSLKTLEEMDKSNKRQRSRCRMTLEIVERKSDFSRIVTG